MRKKDIFIASASEPMPMSIAMSIAHELASRGYNPLRWWKEFPPGSITIERLLEIAKRVDGAIFICSSIDKIWYRPGRIFTPIDNVLLEYGMFMPNTGLQKTILLKDNNIKLPSDLFGITFENLLEDINTVAERVADHFDSTFQKVRSLLRKESLNIIADREVTTILNSSELPSKWLMRSFYTGEGAKAWRKVLSDPVYQSEEVKADLRKDILQMIRNLDVQTFVSLGPGDGLLDREIAIILRNQDPGLQYIPVDISDGLLQQSYNLLAQQVNVPIGILGDFEDHFNFIDYQIRLHANSPILFGLIGNTFGNLDSCESRFMHNIKSCMSKSDYLLIELALIKKGAGHTNGGVYGDRKRFDFFVHHLLGVEPPDWNRMEKN